ncbi:YggS family pyridoxal phosphate-dependent enzyme [Zhaonella formicivorans]|uniref:YggS family pyridoxal phosphate-dependent enzyme n=1 Tax=Zhaonella formicivorans TaxID=2528593 RepID=UPI0010E03836|nr:YggS family pyridoxal phosphate-dependent enzyme [Zhaonella formicivorans]
MSQIAANLAEVKKKIIASAERVGRDPAEIKLIAVTKTVGIPQMLEAIEAGVTAIGENRVQEINRKFPELHKPVEWHLIGHLQTNKVKYIIDKVALIHSLDSLSLAEEISKRARQAGKEMPVLVQVNVAEEESKHGLKLGETEAFIRNVANLDGLRISGLMTMAPLVEDPEEARPVFRRLRLLSEELRAKAIPGIELRYLSMGMTNDFEVAIEEGANLIRIGTAIFGARS